ncbi:hypothetical protein PF003_g31930 [Phytophthora fragariae]|nr:hypothetical protein PF003_g31930 [Phytophthora fragariae]
MAARRETRSEHDAFLSRLAGRSLEERQRLSADHRAYLDAVAATPATPRARAAPPLPPRGKDACYLANAKKLRASRLAEEAAKKKGAPGKKNMSKRQAAEIQREEKRLKEARAVARATTAAAARASKKKAERARVAAEEQRGSEDRRAALSQLQEKDGDGAVITSRGGTSTAAGKRKVTSRSAPKGKKKLKKTSPHVVDPENDADADDESASVASSASAPLAPRGNEVAADDSSIDVVSTPYSSRQAARSLSMDSCAVEVADTSVANDVAPSSQPTDGEPLNSDVEGDVDSEDWNTKMEVVAGTGTGTVDEGDVGQPRLELQVEGAEEEDLSEGSDGGLDGEVLLARQKRHAKRQLERERLAAAKAKLSRDWSTTTANWDTLTTEEMEALALDHEALKKLRADGWNFGTFDIY